MGTMLSARRRSLVCALLATSAGALLVSAAPASAHRARPRLVPGSLLVSSSLYRKAAITPGETLPVNCVPTPSGTPKALQVTCGTAGFNGTYPTVFNNALSGYDGSFGVTSPIFLNDLTPSGRLINQVRVPADQMVTSFSSKSELALNFSTDGQDLTFMGYAAPIKAIDVSNSNTPGGPSYSQYPTVDPTNPVPQSYFREAADLNRDGRWSFTETNAYSGNNPRAAILDDTNHELYTAGNAGNGNNPQPNGIILGAGAQIFPPDVSPLTVPTPVGSFNITQLGDAPDKIGKDTNFRGLAIYHNVVYLTKGSGGNGVNTVYFIDTTGSACPNGVGIPSSNAALPTAINYIPADLQTKGVYPYNMCILKGFPTALKSTTSFPFGIWFANPDTLYVADEGNGDNTYTNGQYSQAAAQTTAGLQKWTFDGTTWKPAYTLFGGLNLGKPYTVPGYPTGNNPATNLPWSPATDGLRNIAGRVNRNGTVTIYAVTSTVSGSGDQGADPNKVVAITDRVDSTTGAGEQFTTVDSARTRQVLRGVAIVPDNFGRGR